MKFSSTFIAVLLYGNISLLFPAAIHLNQVGFYPSQIKIAVITGAEDDTFSIIDTNGRTKFKGLLRNEKFWDASEEKARVAEFSSMCDTGTFYLRIKGCSDSYPFVIKPQILEPLVKSSIKSFYFNRAGLKLEPRFAGKWARNAGHPDTAVLIHPAAASENVAAGSKVCSPMGWYDAGDFGKYVVNSGITTYTLLAALETFPDYFGSLNINIPESSNNLPDILDECMWNVKWMLTMQDTFDGGVYHKLTSARFCGDIMPESDTAARYLLPKSVTATLDFSAVMAQAYRILKKYEKQYPGMARRCLDASLRAWKWARKNPTQFYEQNLINEKYEPDVVTGEYRERTGDGKDELVWAATELYIATKQDSFFNIAYPSGKLSQSLQSWQDVGTLGLFSLYINMNNLTPLILKDTIIKALKNGAEIFRQECDTNAYQVSMAAKDYYWGSNAVAANKGVYFVMAYLATGESAFRDAAVNQLDYLLGRNPLGYSFVTGFGVKSSINVHHRASIADSVFEPVPGFLSGGPNAAQQDAVHCDYYTSKLPALSYLDMACSYASNEVAINWNAPLVFLAGAIDALQREGK